MKFRKSLITLLFSWMMLTAFGCSAPPPAAAPDVAAATQKFVEFCKKEFNYEVKVQVYGKTVWIYFPFTEEIGKLVPALPSMSAAGTEKRHVLQSVDGAFRDGAFEISYDVDSVSPPLNQTSKSPSINYTDEFNQRQNNIFSAMFNAYFGEGKVPEGLIFFVIILADVDNAVISSSMVNANDFLQARTGAMAQDEYVKRYMSEVLGAPALRNDWAGLKVNYHEVSWQEFLTEQIIHRIRFQFTQSAFPPTEEAEEEILRIINRTVGYYNFTNFNGVVLNDLRGNARHPFSKEELKVFEEK